MARLFISIERAGSRWGIIPRYEFRLHTEDSRTIYRGNDIRLALLMRDAILQIPDFESMLNPKEK